MIMGIDPGFAAMGWAATSPQDGDWSWTGGTIRTQVSSRRTSVLAADDNVRRMRHIWRELSRVLDEHQPQWLACETQSWPRNSTTTAKLGMTWGVIVAVAEARELPVYQVPVGEAKFVATGERSAEKVRVIRGMRRLCPGLSEVLAAHPRGQQSHIADAAACCVYAWRLRP